MAGPPGSLAQMQGVGLHQPLQAVVVQVTPATILNPQPKPQTPNPKPQTLCSSMHKVLHRVQKPALCPPAPLPAAVEASWCYLGGSGFRVEGHTGGPAHGAWLMCLWNRLGPLWCEAEPVLRRYPASGLCSRALRAGCSTVDPVEPCMEESAWGHRHQGTRQARIRWPHANGRAALLLVTLCPTSLRGAARCPVLFCLCCFLQLRVCSGTCLLHLPCPHIGTLGILMPSVLGVHRLPCMQDILMAGHEGAPGQEAVFAAALATAKLHTAGGLEVPVGIMHQGALRYAHAGCSVNDDMGANPPAGHNSVEGCQPSCCKQ